MSIALGLAAVAAAIAPVAAGAATDGAAAQRRTTVTGRSPSGGYAFRLEGPRLTVRLPRRLAPRAPRSRVPVTALCGDEAGTRANARSRYRSLYAPILVTSGARSLSAPRGARVLRFTLDRDVAASASWCAFQVEHGRTRLVQAWLRPVAGRREGCLPGASPVRLDTDRALVVVAGDGRDVEQSDHVARGCAKPDGEWRYLAAFSGHRTLAGTRFAFAGGGTWVAWAREFRTQTHEYACSLGRLDLASGEPAAAPALAAGRCAKAVAIAANGTTAWIGEEPVFARPPGHPGPWADDELFVQRADGRDAVRLDAAPHGALGQPALSGDGATATWTRGGAPQSAPVP